MDSLLYGGSKLYGVKYVEPDSQIVFGEDDVVKDIRNEIYEEQSIIKGYNGDDFVDKVWEMFENYGQVVYSRKGELTVNYQPNEQVQDLMATRPNILKEAKDRLEIDTRNLIESQNSGFASIHEDIFGQITSGVTKSITEQRELRTRLIQQQVEAQQVVE